MTATFDPTRYKDTTRQQWQDDASQPEDDRSDAEDGPERVHDQPPAAGKEVSPLAPLRLCASLRSDSTIEVKMIAVTTPSDSPISAPSTEPRRSTEAGRTTAKRPFLSPKARAHRSDTPTCSMKR